MSDGRRPLQVDNTPNFLHGSRRVCVSWRMVLLTTPDKMSAEGNSCRWNTIRFRSRRLMLKFRCLLCGVEWGNPKATESDISHGYCPTCIRKRYTHRIHESQLRMGYSDCFNRGYNDCGEDNCCFRAACQDHLIQNWKEAIIRRSEVADSEGSVQTM